MDVRYFYELVVSGWNTYWRIIVTIGGVPVASFVVLKIAGEFLSKITGGSDWNQN